MKKQKIKEKLLLMKKELTKYQKLFEEDITIDRDDHKVLIKLQNTIIKLEDSLNGKNIPDTETKNTKQQRKTQQKQCIKSKEKSKTTRKNTTQNMNNKQTRKG